MQCKILEVDFLTFETSELMRCAYSHNAVKRKKVSHLFWLVFTCMFEILLLLLLLTMRVCVFVVDENVMQ